MELGHLSTVGMLMVMVYSIKMMLMKLILVTFSGDVDINIDKGRVQIIKMEI